jgi:hypothetical protein
LLETAKECSKHGSDGALELKKNTKSGSFQALSYRRQAIGSKKNFKDKVNNK